MPDSSEQLGPNRNKVLVVDDDPSVVRLISCWLETAGYQVRQAGDGQQALLAMEAECPDFLITDWQMPRMDGMDLCRRLRQLELPHYVFVLFLSVRSTLDEIIAGLEVGADEFLTKPVCRTELLARMHAGHRVLQLEWRLRQMAHNDPLTELPTRRTFFTSLAREFERAKRFRLPISCVMIDIDFFKRINDVHGHAAGDAVLRAVAQEISRSSRKSDLVCRYGGEEFCAMLPETAEFDAAQWAERLRNRLAAMDLTRHGVPSRITCSFGTAQKHDDTQTCEQLVDQADQALLCAKRSGRDRVVRFESLSETGERKLDERGEYGGLFYGITAHHVMTPVVACLREDDTVGQAAEFFLESRINSTPVVDSEGRLSGMLSEKDLMAAFASPGFWNRPVRELKRPNVISYDPETPIRTIYEFLCRVAIRRVVIADQGRPVGTISRATLLRWFRNLVLAKGLVASGDSPDVTPPFHSRDPRERLAETARELAGQVSDLERHLREPSGDLAPYMIGGATRIQELLNDLLAHCRCANRSAGSSADAILVDTHYSD